MFQHAFCPSAFWRKPDSENMPTSLCFGDAVILVLMVLKKILCQCVSFPLVIGFLSLGISLRFMYFKEAFGRASK